MQLGFPSLAEGTVTTMGHEFRIRRGTDRKVRESDPSAWPINRLPDWVDLRKPCRPKRRSRMDLFPGT
jgi:hypothetical protein